MFVWVIKNGLKRIDINKTNKSKEWVSNSNYSKLTIHYYDYCYFLSLSLLLLFLIIMIIMIIVIVISYRYYVYKRILWGIRRNETVNRLKNSYL